LNTYKSYKTQVTPYYLKEYFEPNYTTLIEGQDRVSEILQRLNFSEKYTSRNRLPDLSVTITCSQPSSNVLVDVYYLEVVREETTRNDLDQLIFMERLEDRNSLLYDTSFGQIMHAGRGKYGRYSGTDFVYSSGGITETLGVSGLFRLKQAVDNASKCEFGFEVFGD
jgi:hypothetical protein